MLLLRWLILLFLLSAGLSFACFMVTGQPRFKRYGLRVLLLTLIGAFVFFGVMIVQQL